MRRDSADVAAEAWAIPMRELLGLTQPRQAKDYVGGLRCTLAARRDLHHGSRGKVEVHYPDYPFHGDAALVNTVYKRLPETLQEIMVAHYCVTSPKSKLLRAELMGIGPRAYWSELARAKAAIFGALAVVESVRTVSAPSSGIWAIS